MDIIEATHGDGLGGSSIQYGFSKEDEKTIITTAVQHAKQAKIAVLLLPGVGTIEHLKRAHSYGASVVRVATHCTEADVSEQHIRAAKELGMDTVGFLMMAHRTSAENARRSKENARLWCRHDLCHRFSWSVNDE
ncbi:4-hydroxy-2-oxovalerate aldolase [Geomicrobium sp. JCM 19037]|nr:4-hydroxy-2-oxovalerate aldolase [Geomicrobium sp. JCM 19037]